MSAPVVFFNSVGYLRIPSMVESDERRNLCKISSQIAELCSGNVTRHPDRSRIDRAVSMHKAILGVATSDRLLGALEPVLGPDIELIENRHNHLSAYWLPATDRLH